jgi:macrocin-O-methyltransferase TylF-like protien
VTIDPATREKAREWLAARTPEVDRYRREQAVERIYIPRQASREISGDRIELYDIAASTLGDVPLQYLEFGVFSGRSIAEIARRFPHPQARFFGFDSFEGLPEAWGGMAQTTFTTRGRIPSTSDPRISFVSGWFQNSLPDFLGAGHLDPERPVLVHYDADLYSSTLFVLSTLWHRVPEYHFIFDEFMSEEVVALHDFARAYPIEVDFLCQTNAGGYPSQVFGQLRRVPFVPDRANDPLRS